MVSGLGAFGISECPTGKIHANIPRSEMLLVPNPPCKGYSACTNRNKPPGPSTVSMEKNIKMKTPKTHPSKNQGESGRKHRTGGLHKYCTPCRGDKAGEADGASATFSVKHLVRFNDGQHTQYHNRGLAQSEAQGIGTATWVSLLPLLWLSL